jgi:hypothetical protein
MKRILISLAVAALFTILIVGLVLSCSLKVQPKPAHATPTPIHQAIPPPFVSPSPYRTPIVPNATPQEGNG